MFEKIKLIYGKIRFFRFKVTWQDGNDLRIAECLDREEANAIKDMLKRININSEITETEIPPHLKEYDGILFDGTFEEAIFFVNGCGKYSPILLEIERLKSELTASDYQAIKYAEGLITEAEYQPIKEARQAIRDKINELEGN